MPDLLIHCGPILTMDSATPDLDRGDILIQKGVIVAIGRTLSAPHAQTLDLGDMIVMPGLVNAHLHTWQTAMRGVAGDWSLAEYGRRMHAGFATAFRPDDIYIANLVGALNQINSGVTTLFDWSHNNPTPDHSDRAIDALFDSGIRAVFGHGTPKPRLDGNAVPTDEFYHPEEEVRRIRERRLSGDDGRVTMALCIRGPDLSSIDACAHDVGLARKYGLFASAHIGGRMPQNRRTREGIRPMAKLGLLGPDFNVVHANKLSDDELALLVDAGASFTTTPEVETQMGHGFPVTGRILALGGAPSIGTDVEPAVGGDLLWQARFALQVQRGLDNAAIHRDGVDVAALGRTTRQALEWATAEGAKALRLEQRVGSLTPGKQADLIAIRVDGLDAIPASDPAQIALFRTTSANIDTVTVGGQIVKRGGRLVFPDIEARTAQLAASRRRIFEEAESRQSPAA